MPRVARKKSESGYYHIILRGINKQNIFYDDEDRKVLLNRIKLFKEKVGFKVVAFCLMTNHVHLLIKEERVPVGTIIGRILSSYVYWYNSKYERVGHLFQERFRSEAIEKDDYLLCCVRYILQNPVKAKLCDSVWEYKWSSANLILKEGKSFVDDQLIKGMLQDQTKQFIEQENEDKFLEWESKIKYTDEKMQQKVKKTLNNVDVYSIKELDKEKRNKLLKKIMQIDGISIRQASRMTGAPISAIRHLQ
ncbi:MAG: transposase [Clostridia bacterium]